MNAKTAAVHPVLETFTPWSGVADLGCQVNFLGVQTSIAYSRDMEATPHTNVQTEFPSAEEEVFEWIDLLEAVIGGEGLFTMVELGAGWGRWTANAAAACRVVGRPYRFVAVEAEPTHFAWLQDHLARNDVTAELVHAAVAGTDGTVRFRVGAPDGCYGQRILRSWRERVSWRRDWGGRTRRVPAVSLATLLDGVDRVDLLDLDVQSAEADVLTPAARLLDDRVARVHIGTHPPRANEDRLRDLFRGLGWQCVYDYAWGTETETRYGRIAFEDGVQTWVNPHLQLPRE